ncbi:MAG: hypothetical protein ABSC51_07035 [Gaiellaceae bacterium]|jgi:hypothetical protein
MNDIDRLVKELYSADSPLPPTSDTLWASVERRIDRASGSGRIPRRRPRRRLALVLGVALAGAILFALLPAGRHSVGGSIPESASAAQVLRTLANRGSPLPDVPRGSFLFTGGTRTVLSTTEKLDGTRFSVFIRQHWQLWVGRDGSVRDRMTVEPVPVGYPSARDRRLAHGYREPSPSPSAQITRSPEAFRNDFGLTLTALRGLPTNPGALARELLAISRARYEQAAANDPFHSAFYDPFAVASSILKTPVRPATRTAMLRALASLPRVRRLPDESQADRRVVAVALRFTAYGSRFDHVLLLDPTTGELVGARYVSLARDGRLSAGSVINRWTWRQAVVPTLHSRPAGW